MHHHIAADDRQALIGTIEAHMLGAIGIDDAVARDKGIGRRTICQCCGVVPQQGLRTRYRRSGG
nr:hypothetical protein [Xanthomonas arboricola]